MYEMVAVHRWIGRYISTYLLIGIEVCAKILRLCLILGLFMDFVL